MNVEDCSVKIVQKWAKYTRNGCNHLFECLFSMESCQVAVCSRESYEKAFALIARHIDKHLNTRKCAQKKGGDDTVASKSSVQLPDSILIDLHSIGFHFDLSNRSVSVDTIVMPIDFDAQFYAQIIDVDYKLTPQRQQSGSDFLCNEEFSNQLLEWSLLLRRLNNCVYGSLSDHDYPGLPWQLLRPFLYNHLCAAVSLYNRQISCSYERISIDSQSIQIDYKQEFTDDGPSIAQEILCESHAPPHFLPITFPICGESRKNYREILPKVLLNRVPFKEERAKRAIALEALTELKSMPRLSGRKAKICQCQICLRTFTRKNSLKYHLLCHSGDVRFSCPFCAKLFRHSGHFRDHLRIHQHIPYVCPHCENEFKTRSEFRRHIRRSHMKRICIEEKSSMDDSRISRNAIDIVKEASKSTQWSSHQLNATSENPVLAISSEISHDCRDWSTDLMDLNSRSRCDTNSTPIPLDFSTFKLFST